jgi:hypothetical protein
VVVAAARLRFAELTGYDTSPAARGVGTAMHVAMLAFPYVGPALTHTIVCLNWSVWHESRVFFSTLGHTPLLDSAVARLCKSAADAWLSAAKPAWRISHAHLPSSYFDRTIPTPPHLLNPYGSALAAAHMSSVRTAALTLLLCLLVSLLMLCLFSLMVLLRLIPALAVRVLLCDVARAL